MADQDQNVPLQSQIQALIKATADRMEMKTAEQLQSIVLSVETINNRIETMAGKKDIELVGSLKKDVDELNANLKKNQEFIDNFIADQGKRTNKEKKNFGDAWEMSIKENIFGKSEAEVSKMTNQRNMKFEMELKVGNMTSSNVTGDVVANYGTRQGIVPSQTSNFRDLLPTTPSPTGLYVTYRESATSGSISAQTEGNAKTQIDYSFTEQKAVSKYISGWAKFSKQLMYNLPFLSTTLARVLLRDFYKKENDYLFTTIAGNSTGTYTGAGTVDAEEVINTIASQRKANFEASFGIIDWAQWGRLLVTKPNDYSVPGGMMIDANGTIRIAGVPIIAASWAQTDHILVLDSNFYERVETESLRVEFSYEDSDNFEKNLVTARVECFEEINRLRDDASIYRDFANS